MKRQKKKCFSLLFLVSQLLSTSAFALIPPKDDVRKIGDGYEPKNQVGLVVPKGYPARNLEQAVEYTQPSFMLEDDAMRPSFAHHPQYCRNPVDGFKSFRDIHFVVRDGVHYPFNPAGETGINGRGDLGKFGANFAADPIVTTIIDGVRVFKLIQRADIREDGRKMWAIPGGMAEPKEQAVITAFREFQEETGAAAQVAKIIGFDKPLLPEPAFQDKSAAANEIRATRAEFFRRLTEVLGPLIVKIYAGFMDDWRNTNNAWMETTAFLLCLDAECLKANEKFPNLQQQRILDVIARTAVTKPETPSEVFAFDWVPLTDVRITGGLFASHNFLVALAMEVITGQVRILRRLPSVGDLPPVMSPAVVGSLPSVAGLTGVGGLPPLTTLSVGD